MSTLDNSYQLCSSVSEPAVQFNNPFHKLFQKRVIFVILGFFGYTLVYIHKVMLSVTIVFMTGKSSTAGANSTKWAECAANSTAASDSAANHTRPREFQWTGDEQALLLGAYFYGYVVLQLPGALLAQRLGGKWIFGPCIMAASLLCLLGPVSARSGLFGLFFAVRFGQGLVEGVVAATINTMMAKWLPTMERTLGSSVIFTGSQIGSVLGLSLSGVLCDEDLLGGWPAVFYVFGGVGCVWFALWTALVYESPDTHPTITSRELTFIRDGQNGRVKTFTSWSVIPWRHIFSSVSVYALIVTHFGQQWGFLTLLTTLPRYFEDIFRFDIEKNGFMSCLPYILQSVSACLAGYLSDRVRKTGRFSVSAIRKFNNTIAFIGPAVCLLGVVLSRCDSTLSVIFFSLAMTLNGPSYAGYRSTHVDMAPDFAGVLMGITNTVANIPGFLSPIVVNAYTKHDHSLENWSFVFYTSSVIYVVSALSFVLFSSAELQTWGLVRHDSDKHIDF